MNRQETERHPADSGNYACIHPLWAAKLQGAFSASPSKSDGECLTEHAGIVDDYLEPLCRDNGHPLCCDFRDRCEELAQIDTVASLCQALEVESVGSLSQRQWLIWASRLKMNLLDYMYCLANFFISPIDDSTTSTDEADLLVESYMLLGRGLSFFDRDADAISVLLRFLNLPVDGLEQADSEAWREAFCGHPFADAKPNLRLTFARTTAETARFASQRGNEIGALILESFLQIPPDSIFGTAEDTVDASRALHSALRTAFEGATPLNTLNSVGFLGDIWSFVETRRHIPAIQIFLGFDYGRLVEGVEDSSRVLETDSTVPARVSEALNASLRKLDPEGTLDPDSKLHFFRRLSDELVYVSGNGHTAATVVLESVIGVTGDAYRDRETLAAQLEAGLAGQVKNIDGAATLLWTLGDRLRSTHGRGARASVQLFEAFIGTQPQDFADQSKLRDKLYKESRLARATIDNRANVVGVFADCLRMVFGRGPVHALRLFEAFLGLDADDYQSDELFAEKWSRCDIAGVTSFNRPGIIAPYAECLGDVRGRGRFHALRLLETACDIRPRGKTVDQIAAELADSKFLGHLEDPDTAIGLVGQLAKTLAEPDSFDASASSNAADAASLVDAFLSVAFPDVAQNESLAEQLLTVAESNNVLNFLLVFATALASPEVREDGRAIALLCSCLGLSESDLASEDLVRTYLRESAKQFQMSPGVKERLVWNLADVIRQLGTEGELTAARLLRSSINAPVETVFNELGQLELAEQLEFVRVWLLSAPIESEAFWRVLKDTVRVVVTARDELLQSFTQRRDFVDSGRLLWNGVRARVLSWIKRRQQPVSAVDTDRTSDGGSSTERERLTQLLLDSEQFENRILVEEFRLTASTLAHRSTTWPTGLDSERSSLAHEWTTAEVRKEFNSWWDGRRHQRPQQVARALANTSSSPLSGCLGRSSAVAPEASFQTHLVDNDFVESDVLPHVGTDSTTQVEQLSDLFTAPCLWLRTLFDADGALWWWAFRCNSEQVEYVASDVSHVNAHSRLTDANFVFDATVESIWHLYRVWLTEEHKRDVPLNALESFERGRCKNLARALAEQHEGASLVFPMGQIDAIERALVTAADKKVLPQAFVVMGRQLCQRLRGTAPVAEDIRILANGWKKCIELLSAELWGDAELHQLETKQHLPVQEWWRRNELHDATKLHLKALEAEWDLGIFDSLHGVLDDTTDVVFQVQGPLLAMPLSWLSVGESPIYSLVNSTSTSISLTLNRAASAMSKASVPTTSIERGQPTLAREALSAIWVDRGDERESLLGLPFLENGLRELAAGANGEWHVYSACDEPVASSELLRSALAAADHQVELLLIGGHGKPTQAGITLADGLWDGAGMNLANVKAVILASCAVGRLFQQGTEDVVGLLSRLFVHGARCVVAARWPIGDRETAEFMAEFLEVYLNETDTSPFHVARSLNSARRSLLNSSSRRRDVLTLHTAAAFDVYGFA